MLHNSYRYTQVCGSISLPETQSAHENVTWSMVNARSRRFSLTRRDRGLKIIEELLLFNGTHRIGVDADDAGE